MFGTDSRRTIVSVTAENEDGCDGRMDGTDSKEAFMACPVKQPSWDIVNKMWDGFLCVNQHLSFINCRKYRKCLSSKMKP